MVRDVKKVGAAYEVSVFCDVKSIGEEDQIKRHPDCDQPNGL
jgi:hypothetical protein